VTGLLIRGGIVVDPHAGAMREADLLVEDGVVAAIGSVDGSPQVEVIDASGLYLAPGFIDIHTHVFNHGLFGTTRLDADRVGVQQGVACLVDAGSAGATTIDAFPRVVHASERTPVYALVNVGSPGLPHLGGGHSSRPELVSLDGTVRAAEEHRGWVRGIKVQASGSHTGMFGINAVKIARKAADLTGLPLMMHVGNAPPVLDEALEYLREGDIVTHAYHGKVGGALTHGGEPLPALLEAIARGVYVDIGHGRSSFSFATAERALAAGLPVHSISTDIHRGNIDRYVISLARTMSKLLMLGLDLVEVVAAVTSTPARALRLDADGFGAIEVGRPAHLTLFAVRDEPIELEDSGGEVRRGERAIEPTVVLVGGERFDVSAPL
jgi:dihydroorotase